MNENLDLGSRIPEALNDKPKKRFSFKLSLPSRLPSKKQLVLASVFLVFATVGWFGFRVLSTWSAIHDSDTAQIRPPAWDRDLSKLRGEGDGRVNVLFLGMGGAGHSGGLLADTIMVASVDPETGHLAMLSLPRDLWVQIPGTNNFSKINAVYSTGEQRNKGGGPSLMKQAVANTLDITIHYYVKVDFQGFQKIIDTVGGIDVNNPTNLVDYSYPCDGLRGYCPFKLGAGPQHLNGETALKYARCRKGTCGNDFGRARRQQDVITAAGAKVKASETFLNPGKIDKILASLGSHVRTDIKLDDVKRFIEVGKKIDPGTTTNAVLSNESTSFLVSGSAGGGYILKPKTGNFKAIQEYVHSIFVDPWIKKENARVELLNGTIQYGLAQQLSKSLKNYNYNVTKVGDADRKDYKETVIVDYTGGKVPFTIKYLELRFGVKSRQETKGDDRTSDILVIVGNNYR